MLTDLLESDVSNLPIFREMCQDSFEFVSYNDVQFKNILISQLISELEAEDMGIYLGSPKKEAREIDRFSQSRHQFLGKADNPISVLKDVQYIDLTSFDSKGILKRLERHIEGESIDWLILDLTLDQLSPSLIDLLNEFYEEYAVTVVVAYYLPDDPKVVNFFKRRTDLSFNSPELNTKKPSSGKVATLSSIHSDREMKTFINVRPHYGVLQEEI
ncbi:hypothetical protein [Alkalibacillus salilacus]|uniref:Uncharacterized protein n=1 Tax=Alkalibacillus salilacus TaxID=284582 RepID=A0ABT9VID5_9BACI|nr:hypothetical protein [Alkalibacillus salilacus]MDQ0160738.1 hypothetical protein [Alkalibacillus salilacus]